MNCSDSISLEITNITKYYGKFRALHQFSLNMEAGVYGLLGANGAGKTTIIKILLELLTPEQGEILWNGKNIKAYKNEYLKKIGYMPQYPMFYDNFKITEFLDYMCILKGIPAKKRAAKIDEVLHLVNLVDAKRKRIGALSGGMRQRLGIAQAILNDPQILILDEPTAGLDPRERIRFRNIVSKLSKDKIIIYATHIVSDIEMIANQVVFLKDGELILNGSIREAENTIYGKVWEVRGSFDEINHLMERFMVGNIKNEQEEYIIKVIHNTKPTDNAQLVKPTLEDVFLTLQETNETVIL